MPRTEKPAPIPDWLKPTLKKAIKGEAQPDTMDFQIVSAALAGVELDALKTRFDLQADEILKSLLRVACAVRSGALDRDTLDAYPDLLALATKKAQFNKVRDNRPTTGKKVFPEKSLAVIDTSDLPEIVPGDDKSLHEFLVAAKAKYARQIITNALQALNDNVNSVDGMVSNMAVSKILEMFYGVGRRGPGVAMQLNFGDKPGEKQSDTPHFFEETILEAEALEGSVGGETTVFDERLLGQQEES